MTQTEIANLALGLIGGKSLTDVTTDTTAQAVSVRKFYDVALKEALSAQPWNFAAKRARLTTTWTALSGVALANNGSGLIRVTKATHGLVTGDRSELRKVQGVTSANALWYVTRIDADNFDLDGSVFSGSHTSGTGEFVKVPPFSWSFQHSVPSDCVKARKILDDPDASDDEENTGEPFRVEDGLILCNLDTVYLVYTFLNTTTTDYPAEFITAFSTLLASYIAQDLSGPAGRSGELRQTYERLMLPNARGRDAREGRGRTQAMQHTQSDLHASRFSGLA
jgi:hypothetical protein